VCEHCGEPMGGGEAAAGGDQAAGGGNGKGARGSDWQQDLSFWCGFGNVAIHEFDWCLQESAIRSLSELVAKAERAMETNDEAGGRLLLNALKGAMDQHCGGLMDLIEAAFVRRMGIGQLDQNQRLGAKLDEFKRRVTENEPPQSPAMRKLRDEINAVKQEILAGLGSAGKVECQFCHKMRTPPSPMAPKCEHCGGNPFVLR